MVNSVFPEVSTLRSFMAAHFISRGFQTSLRSKDNAAWVEGCLRANYCPTFYTNTFLAYQVLNEQERPNAFFDLSMVVLHQQQVIAVFPMNLHFSGDESRGELYVLPPLIVANVPPRICKELLISCATLIDLCQERFPIVQIRSEEMFMGNLASHFSDWHLNLMKRGHSISVQHDLLVDLTIPESEYWKNIRSSYRSQINAGYRSTEVVVLDERKFDKSIWESFRNLHATESKRITRNDATWDFLFQELTEGRGLLAVSLNTEGGLLGGTYVTCSNTEGIYGIGVYRKYPNALPVSPVLQHKVISELRDRKLLWYKLGIRHFAGDYVAPTEKEESISFYKEGFATHILPKYQLLRVLDI